MRPASSVFALLTAPLLALTLALAAAPGGAVAGQAPSGPPIILGMSAAFSGPTRGLGLELLRGATACLREVNDAGGVLGRPVVLRPLDDFYSPGPAIENTIALAEDKNVFALFGFVGTPTTTRIIPLLERYAASDLFLLFPLTGAEPLRREPYSRWIFNLRASYFDETRALVDGFVHQGRTRIAVLHQADAFGRAGWDGVRRALTHYDMTIAAEATYKRGASMDTDMRPQVEILARRNPDAVIAIATAEACAAFVRDAREAGLKAPVATVSFAGAEHMLELLQDAGAKSGTDYATGLISSQVVPSYEDLSLPAVREYRGAMDALALRPGLGLIPGDYSPPRYSFVSFEGYLDARLAVECLRRMGPDVRRSRIRPVLEAMDGLDLGIGEPVGFGPGRHQALSRVYFAVVRDGRFVPLGSFGRWKQ